MIYKLIGKYLKHQRIKRGYTLRAFCMKYYLDPSTISKIERGCYFKDAPEDKWREKITTDDTV